MTYDVTVTSHEEMDTINELFGVDLVWFDTMQRGKYASNCRLVEVVFDCLVLMLKSLPKSFPNV